MSSWDSKPANGERIQEILTSVASRIKEKADRTATETALGNRVYGKTVTLGSSEALSINIPYALRTGRSAALVLISGNNGKYCLMELGWFKAASDSIPTNRFFSHVVACRDTDQDCIPKVYITYGTSEYGCGIYLVRSGTSWATQMTVMLNCENVFDVAISPIDQTVAATATDVSGDTVVNMDDRRIMDSSSSASWGGDDTHLPTCAAVEAKISAAMSGTIGGYKGEFNVAQINNNIAQGMQFKNGDWFTVLDSGTINYHIGNTGSAATLTVLEGDSVYWTTSGTLETRTDDSVRLMTLTSSNFSDWNNLTNAGMYQVNVNGASNAPSTGLFSCLVSNVNGNIRQFAMSSNNLYYRGKGQQSGWTDWRSVQDATNYVYNGNTVSIGADFVTVKADIQYLTLGKKIRVVDNLPASPDNDCIYFI